MFSIQKKSARILLACVALSFMLSACGTASGSPDQAGGDSAPQQSSAQGSGASFPDQQLGSDIDHADTQPVDQEAALALAFENASVPQGDAYHVQIKQDTEGGIPVYKIEFETQYGDYDFEVSIADGRIVGADYEVDEEWLDTLGGSPVTLEEAKDLVAAKVPGADGSQVSIRQEAEDGRGRYEGRLYHDEIQYEFEMDPKTGIIFDWNADLRG